MEAKDFLEEIDYYNTNVEGELYEELGIETLSDILEVYHQRKLKLLATADVVGQSEQLVSFLRQYQKICEIMHVNKIDAKNFVEQYKTK